MIKSDLNIFKVIANLYKEDTLFRRLIYIVIILKLFLFVSGFLGHIIFPFFDISYNIHKYWEIKDLPYVFMAFNTWDTQHYLAVSQIGYGNSFEPSHDSFYPLYPFFIMIFTPIFYNQPLLAALLVSNLFSLLTIVVFYIWIKEVYGAKTAFLTNLIMIFFPTSFYQTVAYSEPIFLFLMILTFYLLYKEKFCWAALSCFLLPMSRGQGLFIIFPVAVFFLEKFIREKRDYKFILKGFVLLLSSFMGLFAYCSIMKLFTGSFMGGFNAHKYFKAQNSISNLFKPIDWLYRNFIDIELKIHGFDNSIVDRVVFFLFVILLILMIRKVKWHLYIFALMAVLIPELSGNFTAYLRMVSIIFPVFIYLALKFQKNYIYLIVPMFLLQIFLFLRHTLAYWVA